MTPFGRRVAALAETLAASVALVQCAHGPPPRAATPASSVVTSRSVATPTARAAVQPVTAAELGASWRPGCPVDPGHLRRVYVDHIGFDGRTHRGELIVHEDLAAEFIAIFDLLYRQGYPVEKIRTADNYPGADDELSMEDNNTSAFNCRDIPGTSRWSPHAYGRAVDLNPLLNPCIYPDRTFQPHNAAAFTDRGRTDPGLLHDGDPAVRAFTDHGWRWGGSWVSPIDYQHFERP